MKKSVIFQLICVALLWLLLCYLLVATTPFRPKVIFLIIASGIIVFVPLYKKHFRK